MRLEFSSKELKDDKLIMDHFGIAYLISIRRRYPNIWQQLEDLTGNIEELETQNDNNPSEDKS